MKIPSSETQLFFVAYLLGCCSAFAPLHKNRVQTLHPVTTIQHPSPKSTTALNDGVLLDVPEGFFTITMVGSGLFLSIAKDFGRIRMEERAWEQRLEEGRRRRMAEDPTLTELDLRRREAELEWSAYGKPASEVIREEQERSRRRQRVKVMERGAEDDDDDDDDEYRSVFMSDKEIDLFEAEFGIDYDPYYDDPYAEDELPEGNFKTDKKYGDRFYEDGEIFYKEANSGLFYRQGARPRNSSFFGP